MSINLGVGVLTWDGSERRSDRYGMVWLMEDGFTSQTRESPESILDVAACKSLAFQRGTLVATVIDARQSTHIGDLFRGIFPSTPDVGERIVLGTGQAHREYQPYGLTIGLKPDDDRDFDWLDPKALYRAHEQLVALTFEPEGAL